MGAKSSAIVLVFFWWGPSSFLPLGYVKVLNTDCCWHFLDSLGQKWSPGFSTGHSGMMFHSHVGATRILFAPVGKHRFITWGTLPLASKKAGTAGMLTWSTTATLRMQQFQCPSTKTAFCLLFRVYWGLQLPNHPKCQQRPGASLQAGVSRGWATAVSWSCPKALRRCRSEIVLGSCDDFNRLTMTTDLHYQPPDQELSVCHHGRKNDFVLLKFSHPL